MFECDRCGYTTDIRFCLQTHYARKRICPPTKSDVNREVLIDRDFPKKTTAHQCENCMKYFASPQSKWNHKAHCRMTCAIASFGHEKINTSVLFFNIVWDLLENRVQHINWYVEYRFFDGAHPENHTLRRPYNNDYIQCHIGGEWVQNSCENVVTQIMYILETDVIYCINQSPSRDSFFKRDGEFYMIAYRFITRICRPFQLTRLAALMEECKIDNSDECYDEDDLNDMMAGRRLARSLLISRISTIIYNQTTKQTHTFNSATYTPP